MISHCRGRLNSALTRRTPVVASVVGLLLGWACCSGGIGKADAQTEILAHSDANLAAGVPSSWDFSATDITSKALRDEIWVVDAHCNDFPEVKVFRLGRLDRPPRSLPLELPPDVEGAPILGIAEDPHAAGRAANFVLVDAAFGREQAPTPLIGVLDDEGEPVDGAPFLPIIGLDPRSQLSSIDAHEEREEIIAYDIALRALWRISYALEVIDGPLPVEGEPNWFTGAWFIQRSGCTGTTRGAGAGVCWDGPDTVLVTGGFESPFETHLALRYAVEETGETGFAYLGEAVDLSAARRIEFTPDLAFVGIDRTAFAAEGVAKRQDALAAMNFADEALYIFDLVDEPHAAAATEIVCETDPASRRYAVTWQLDDLADVEAIHVVENGVGVARLPAGQRTFTSTLPTAGKTYVEIVTERQGTMSALRPFCEVENSSVPDFADGRPIDDAIQVGGFAMTGCAVTPTPSNLSEFRAYLIGLHSNEVNVFDHTLTKLGTIRLDPVVLRQGRNDAALGIALSEVNGERALAVLDSDGPQGNNVPSISFHSLESDPPGRLLRVVNSVDLSAVSPRPFLFDIDTDPEGHFVAAGRLVNGRFVLVRLLWDGADAIRAVAQVEAPFSSLSPSGEAHGIGVTVLPSGYLLVVGGDAFQRSYAEALLMTPLRDDTSDGRSRLVGFAAGMPLPGEFFPELGPRLGPGLVFGLESTWMPRQDGTMTSVVYLPTTDIELLHNLPIDEVLELDGDLFIHAAVEDDLAHPGLVAEQIADESLTIPVGQDALVEANTTTFEALDSPDLVVWILNRSAFANVDLAIEAHLDGDAIEELPPRIEIGAGRYFRALIEGRAGRSLELALVNRSLATATLRVIVGGKAIDPNVEPIEPRFRRGDCNGDGLVDIADGVFGLGSLFLGGEPGPCLDACDTDDSGRINLSDQVRLLQFLFLFGPMPEDPGTLSCGADPTVDGLETCTYDETSAACP